jgi:hypothetical protein
MGGPNGPNGAYILPSDDIYESDYSQSQSECQYCFSTDGDCGCLEEGGEEEEEEGGTREEEEENNDETSSDYETSSDTEFEKPYDENYAEQMGCTRYVYTD